ERVEQRVDVRSRDVVRIRLPGTFQVTGELDIHAARAGEGQQLAEDRLVDACRGRRTAAVIDQHANAGTFEQRRERDQLIALDLQRHAHVERGKAPEEF